MSALDSAAALLLYSPDTNKGRFSTLGVPRRQSLWHAGGRCCMDPRSSLCQNIPRIVPTREHLDRLLGIWELNGEMIRFLAEPETGVLVAFSCEGYRVNPIRVISGGTKMGGWSPPS